MSGPGKRRIHASPDAREMAACRPWLVAELSLLDPEIVVALGATAAKSLFGPSFRVTQSRGALLEWPAAAAHRDDFLADAESARRSLGARDPAPLRRTAGRRPRRGVRRARGRSRSAGAASGALAG